MPPGRGLQNTQSSIQSNCYIRQSIGNLHWLDRTPFQKRWHNHQTDFRHQKNRSNTALASHIWSLKDQSIDYSLNFEILKKTRAFNPISGKCMLCLYEKYLILFNPTGSTLNLRSEFFNACRHKRNKLIALENT